MSKQEVIETDVRDLISDYLKEDERSLRWLSEKSGIPYGTMYSCFTQRLFKLNEDNLEKINTALGTNFK